MELGQIMAQRKMMINNYKAPSSSTSPVLVDNNILYASLQILETKSCCGLLNFLRKVLYRIKIHE